MKQLLIMRWNTFSTKEKRILAALAWLVAALLLYAFIWQPVQHGRERLAQIVPEKQAKLLLMRSQAADIERLRGQQQSLTASAEALKAAIEVSAKFHGLAPIYNSTVSNENLEKRDGVQLGLTLSQVSFDQWVKWLEALQSQSRVRVLSCNISPEGLAGLVKVEAVLTVVE